MTSDKMPTGTTGGTPQVLLAHHLKQLKLPTVLRQYEKVARECARDGIDHPRYLLRLIELELIDRRPMLQDFAVGVESLLIEQGLEQPDARHPNHGRTRRTQGDAVGMGELPGADDQVGSLLELGLRGDLHVRLVEGGEVV